MWRSRPSKTAPGHFQSSPATALERCTTDPEVGSLHRFEPHTQWHMLLVAVCVPGSWGLEISQAVEGNWVLEGGRSVAKPVQSACGQGYQKYSQSLAAKHCLNLHVPPPCSWVMIKHNWTIHPVTSPPVPSHWAELPKLCTIVWACAVEISLASAVKCWTVNPEVGKLHGFEAYRQHHVPYPWQRIKHSAKFGLLL